MFSFLQKRREAAAERRAEAIAAECQQEVDRTAHAIPQFVSSPRDMEKRAALLKSAKEAGLDEHDAVRRLDYLQRLLAALRAGIDESEPKIAFLEEAARLNLEDASAVRLVAKVRRREQLMDEGPKATGRDSQGRVVYHRCQADHKNKPGHFEVREDGVTFKGEVAIEIAWANVVHAAKTTYTYRGSDSDAVAIQEGKRRTATVFAFGDVYDCEVTLAVWEKSKKQETT